MTPHPYLRAYLAGVFVTTLILPIILAVFIIVRFVLQVPIPIERGIIFPMALVPLGWGLWNMIWLASHGRTHLGVGVHGALFPFVLVPIGATVATSLGVLSFGASGATWFHACSVPYAWLASASAAELRLTTLSGSTSSASSTARSGLRENSEVDKNRVPILPQLHRGRVGGVETDSTNRPLSIVGD